MRRFILFLLVAVNLGLVAMAAQQAADASKLEQPPVDSRRDDDR